jgi:hypothetical protein
MDPKPIRLYAGEDSPRLRYIAGIILGDILGLAWEFTTDRRKLRSHYVINYSACDIDGSFRLVPDPLLFETGIRSREINVNTWNGLPFFSIQMKAPTSRSTSLLHRSGWSAGMRVPGAYPG